MFSLQENLFAYFGPREKVGDLHKDGQGRGTKERFMRALGAEYDAVLLPLLDGFVANCIDPQTALDRFVPYLENQMGVAYKVSDDLAVRRKLVGWASRITRLKGTKRSYEILLKLMGFASVEIVEYFTGRGFDHGKLDDPERRFDRGCAGCSPYSLILTGGVTITADVRAWIRSVVAFCEPINAVLRDIQYNGNPLMLTSIFVRITPDGDLEYDNSADPTTTLQLINGDLLISGPNAARYSLSPQGDLLFT
jgi:hypothetical protein